MNICGIYGHRTYIFFWMVQKNWRLFQRCNNTIRSFSEDFGLQIFWIKRFFWLMVAFKSWLNLRTSSKDLLERLKVSFLKMVDG